MYAARPVCTLHPAPQYAKTDAKRDAVMLIQLRMGVEQMWTSRVLQCQKSRPLCGPSDSASTARMPSVERRPAGSGAPCARRMGPGLAVHAAGRAGMGRAWSGGGFSVWRDGVEDFAAGREVVLGCGRWWHVQVTMACVGGSRNKVAIIC